ncbi:hypothetical protein LZ32DRAFT_650335 [Colletotrichum eremochloae]|nr:hypothetical protein LZ32DRAFT_650335 [Colletotrichum eremochloae]
MRFSIAFWLAPAIVSAQRNLGPPRPPQPQLGGLCCDSRGVADPSLTCQNKSLSAFCCSANHDDVGGGCDGLLGFPVGRDVLAFPPPPAAGDNNFPCGLLGFIGCAANS